MLWYAIHEATPLKPDPDFMRYMLPALLVSVRINAPDIDPRAIVPSIVSANGARVIVERYADYERARRILGLSFRPTEDMADIVVTANLAYDRTENYTLPRAPDPASMAGYYRRMFSRSYLEVSNGRPALAYFNPVLRVVAMDGAVDRLDKIAADIAKAAPSLTVRLIEPTSSNTNR